MSKEDRKLHVESRAPILSSLCLAHPVDYRFSYLCVHRPRELREKAVKTKMKKIICNPITGCQSPTKNLKEDVGFPHS